MKKAILTLIVVLMLSIKGQSQDAALYVYICENKTTILKDTLIKIAKLNVSDTSFIIKSFSYIITGIRIDGVSYPIYGTNIGSKFSGHLLIELDKYQSNKSSFYVTDVVVYNSKKYSGYSIKLAKW